MGFSVTKVSEPMTTLDCGFVLPESVRQELLAMLQEMLDNFNRFSESMVKTRSQEGEPKGKEVDAEETRAAMVREKAEALECASNLKIPASVYDMDSHVKEMEEFPHQSTNGSGKKIAHQLFDQMPSKEKQRKCLKAWKFKFKPTSKRSKTMDVKFFSVEKIAGLTKESKEINQELLDTSQKMQTRLVYHEEKNGLRVVEAGINKSFMTLDRKRSDMTLSLEDKQDDEHEQNQVIKLISSLKNRIWEPGGVLIEHDKWNWLETCYNHGRLMRFRHWMSSMCWKETQDWIVSIWSKIQVFSDFDIASLVGLEIYGCETKKQINIDHISLNGMCNKLVYDEEKKKLRHVGDDVKKGKNSFLRDVKTILALAVKEYRMGKADERLLPGHYGLLHTFDQRGGLNATVIAGTIMQSSLKLFHQLRVACLHHTSLGFLYGSLPRPPEENHSNFSNMLQYHKTWSCISLRNNRVWDPGGSLVDAATPCLLSLHFTALHFIAAILSFLKTLRSRFLQRREICYRKNGHGLVNGPSEKMGCT